jgi:hypothetical protein
MQCTRWEKNLHHVCLLVLMSLGTAYIIYVIESMLNANGFVNQILKQTLTAGKFFFNIQVVYFLILSTYKIRAISYAQGIYNDFKRANI